MIEILTSYTYQVEVLTITEIIVNKKVGCTLNWLETLEGLQVRRGYV